MMREPSEHIIEQEPEMTAVAKRETAPETLPQASENATLIHLIERALTIPSANVENLERLLGMQERIMERNAKMAFSEAMTAAQSEMRPVATDATNPSTNKSKYASYYALDKALRPIYTRNGFALSFDTGDSGPDQVRVLCHVSHRDGFERTYSVLMPADGKGAKGADVMTKTHATGAAMTYGMRYLLKLIFNIAVGEDTDGNMPEGAISDEQVAHLRKVIKDLDASERAILKFAKVDSLEEIPARKYEQVLSALNDWAREKRKPQS